MTETAGHPPVRVHVVADDTRGTVPIAGPPVPPGPVQAGVTGKKRRTVFGQTSLTATNPVASILPASKNRVVAWFKAVTNDVFLCESETKANQNQGMALNAALTAPWPVYGTNPVFAGMITGFPATVNWSAEYEE